MAINTGTSSGIQLASLLVMVLNLIIDYNSSSLANLKATRQISSTLDCVVM
jgi:hypothetical protein